MCSFAEVLSKTAKNNKKTISIPHWYGLSKNEQSKFGLIPPGGGGEGFWVKDQTFCGFFFFAPFPKVSGAKSQ